MRRAAALALALGVSATARADIPTPPQVLYGAFGPRKIREGGEERWRPIEVGFRRLGCSRSFDPRRRGTPHA